MHRAAHTLSRGALGSGEHKASAGRTVNQMEIRIRKVVQVRSRRQQARGLGVTSSSLPPESLSCG